MSTEYEATFINVDKDDMRERLKKVGAELVMPETLTKRHNFGLPKEMKIEHGWLRVRQQGDRITMSVKAVSEENDIDSQKEAEVEVSDINKAIEFFNALGAYKKTYQETKRELWKVDGIEVSIDEWPFLEPFLEIEGKSEKDVRNVASWLGFDYSGAKFCAVDELYADKYKVDKKYINEELKKLTFEENNPFKK